MKPLAYALGLSWLCLACAGGKAQQPDSRAETVPQAPALMGAQFIEDAGGGWLRLRCEGLGADTQTAFEHARRSGLYWLADQRLASSPAERKRLKAQKKGLFAQMERLIRDPKGGGRMGARGLMRRMSRNGQVRVTVIADFDESATRTLLEDLGVLDKLALPAGRKLTIVLCPGSPETVKKLPLLRVLLFSKLKQLPIDWLDIPADAAGEHAANLEIARKASADLLLEVRAEEKKKAEAVSCAVSLRLTRMRDSTTAATAAAQSPGFYAGDPGGANRALQEAANDASAKLSPQLAQVLKSFAAP